MQKNVVFYFRPSYVREFPLYSWLFQLKPCDSSHLAVASRNKKMGLLAGRPQQIQCGYISVISTSYLHHCASTSRGIPVLAPSHAWEIRIVPAIPDSNALGRNSLSSADEHGTVASLITSEVGSEDEAEARSCQCLLVNWSYDSTGRW